MPAPFNQQYCHSNLDMQKALPFFTDPIKNAELADIEERLGDIEQKLDMIIKHFGIVRLFGTPTDQ